MNNWNFADFAIQIQAGLQFAFGGDFPTSPLGWRQIALRAVVIYFVGLMIVRFGKSRLIGRITPLDALTGFVLGSLLGRAITGSASLSGTAVGCASLVTLHWLLTLMACRWHWFGELVKGHASLIVQDGQPIFDRLRHHHISSHDLDEQLRLRGVADVRQVQAAYKERNGEVSVLLAKGEPHVLEVSVAEGVQTVRIKLE